MHRGSLTRVADAMLLAVCLALIGSLPRSVRSATDWPVFFEHLGEYKKECLQMRL